MGTLQVGGTTLGVKNTSTNKVDLSNVGDMTFTGNITFTDITSKFVLQSNWSVYETGHCYLFNGFVLVFLSAVKSSAPSNNETIWIIDSGFRPESSYIMNTMTYQGDTANAIYFYSNGNVQINEPITAGDSVFRVHINGWYKI